MARNRIGNPRSRRGATAASGVAPGTQPTRDPITRQRGGIQGHALIEALAIAGVRRADMVTVWAAVKASPFTAEVLTYKQTARQMLMVPASIYFARFPISADWQVLANEFELVEGVIADLVWLRPGGDIVVDELKTGRLRLADLASLDEQVSRLHGAAHAAFGKRFQTLRICLLARPEESFAVDRTGERQAIHLALPWQTADESGASD